MTTTTASTIATRQVHASACVPAEGGAGRARRRVSTGRRARLARGEAAWLPVVDLIGPPRL